MRFAIDIPNIGAGAESGADFADPRFVAELAYEAEAAGWDGFFLWDHIGAGWPYTIADPWLTLAAVAMRTERIKLGPMVTPLPRRRPWKLARETVTLDHLSGGRLILGVGIGGGLDEFSAYGEPDDARVRAAMLDEGLEVLSRLWSGEQFSYRGAHYQLTDVQHLPRPLQDRIPIWIAGVWPHRRPMQRAARWDGAFPIGAGLSFTEQMPPEDLAAVRAYIAAQRPVAAPFDLVHWGMTPGRDPAEDAAIVAPYAAAGVTWWLENLTLPRAPIDALRERIRRGPPRL